MIQHEMREGRLIITLNRPEKANALTTAMLQSLVDLLGQSHEVSTLILTGAGRIFSAGADLDEVRGGDLAKSPLWEDLSGSISAFPGFTIAALNGSLAGGAMGMVLACDIRFAVPDSKFFYPVMKLGVLPQPSDPARLAALVGPARAKLMLLGADKWDAETALRFGLIDRIVGDPVAHAVALSAAAANADLARVAEIKSMLQ